MVSSYGTVSKKMRRFVWIVKNSRS